MKSKYTEADLLRDAKQYLDLLKSVKKLTYRRLQTTGIPKGNSGFFRPNSAAGMADLIIFSFTPPYNAPLTLHIELKAPKSRLTPNQVAFQAEMAEYGHFYYICHSLDDLMAVLLTHGIASGIKAA